MLHAVTAKRTTCVPIFHADSTRLPERDGTKRGRTKSRVLTWSLFAGFLMGQTWSRSKSRAVAFQASRRTQLLVDADIHSIESIKQGMNLLKVKGRPVQATLFAAPGRIENKQWSQFMTEPGIKFQPVVRSHDDFSEPNDDAIPRSISTLSGRDDIACIAMLTADTDFIEIMVDLEDRGTSAIALIPSNRYEVLRRYEEAQVEVLTLDADRCDGPRVRAVLDRIGNGSVDLADPYESFDNSDRAVSVMAFLEDLGFRERTGYSLPAIAKFWFANRLGPLTVFPFQLATLSLHEVIQFQRDGYARYDKKLAFFLPVAANRGRVSTTRLQKYGNLLAHRVFNGGGPFLLKDSQHLIVESLRRLGYLDDNGLNDDLEDALFCFLNASGNKQILRKIGLLPGSGARSSEVCKQLRAAFLTHKSRGMWQIMRKVHSPVLQILRKAGVIGKGEYLEVEVLEAMRMYAEQHGLPRMRTFNALALRFLRSVSTDPSNRTVIEVSK